MERYNIFSLLCLGAFIALFTAIMSGISFGAFNQAVLIAMCLLPLLGTILGFLGKNNFWKWMAISHNLLLCGVIAFLIILNFIKGGA